MTRSLPPEVQDVFKQFVTTELTTIDHRGQPITWPVTPYYRAGGPCIDVTTGLGYPKKANDARDNPLVSLLFSDPTGCGLTDPPMVLVQGTAEVDDHDLDANRKRYTSESIEKLPGTAKLQPPDALKRFLTWYYTRIYIRVRPERVYVWPGGDVSVEPELHDSHIEEVRSGHSEEPPRFHAAPRAERHLGPAHPRARHDVPHRRAVDRLPDGFPFTVRVPIHVDGAARWIRIDESRTPSRCSRDSRA